MTQRLAAFIALGLFILLVIGTWEWGGRIGLDDAAGERISFQIATGSTTGIYFPVGQAIAGQISHPPGNGRCETATICGPTGVILSARTSEGAADNLRAVNAGTMESGLSEGDVIAQAVTGQGAFRRSGKARRLRVIASLFTEQAQLVAAAKSDIHDVAGLHGKRVMLGGAENSGAAVRARAILAAYGVGWVRVIGQDQGTASQLLQAGKIDAYFTVTGVPLQSVSDLLARGLARLVPIDGEGRDRLVAAVPQLHPAVIPAGAYPGPNGNSGAVETVSTRAWWVTRDSEPDTLIYGLTRALFNPANRPAISASHPSAREIGLDTAAIAPPAPLHSGAARFYREMGKLQP